MSMDKKRNNRSRVLGVVWFIIGLVLVISDNSGGWVFFIIGLVYLASSTDQGGQWIAENPGLARGILIGLVILLVLVVTGLVIINYFRV